MMPLFIFEVVFLPVYLLPLKLFHKYGLLTENRFGIIVVAYLSVMTFTFFWAISTTIEFKLIGGVLAFLCWFPGYPMAKRIYRRIFLRSNNNRNIKPCFVRLGLPSSNLRYPSRSIPEGENRLISVTVSGQTTQFLYDPDGNLVKKI